MTERLTAISGSMFSGKTEEMIRLIKREEIAGRKVEVFKPIIDNRYDAVYKIRSHSGAEYPAVPVTSSAEILSLISADTNVAAVDEIQFFDSYIVPVVQELLDRNIKVYIGGLPLDFRGEPFGSMPILLTKADEIYRLTAICDFIRENGNKCGREATRTQRFVDGKPADFFDPVVVIGGREEGYAARCPDHHVVPNKPKIVFENLDKENND